MTSNPSRITVRIDASCEMAQVEVDGQVIMIGNFWDFHPGCVGGLELFGDDWRSALGLACTVAEHLKIADKPTVDRTWKYHRDL